MHPSVLARRLAPVPLLMLTLAACGGAPAIPDQAVAAAPSQAAPTTVPPTSTATATALPTNTPTSTPTSAPTSTPTEVPTPTAVPDVSLVTGENSFARGAIAQRPWMVMIDNHPDAYPQSGMDKASMVFEGLAEYGITRFIALFEDGISDDVSEIGPIRSTRLYFAQWAMGFHPIYAHAGGSPDGVQLAESTDQLVNFEALRLNSFTWRDNRRIAPHNLYTSSELLRSFAADKQAGAFDPAKAGYLFDHIPPSPSPAATELDYYFLDRGSLAGFRYDATTNGYFRVMRGKAHTDRNTGKQLWTRNVVVMQVAEAARAGDAKQRIDQEVVGSGTARLFSAGGIAEITWRKDAAEAPLRFYDAADKEVVFNAGPIWVAAVPTMERLTVR